MKKIILLYLIFITIGVNGQSQLWPVRLCFGNESTAIPFTRFFTTPVHPSFQAGTEFKYKGYDHHYLYQTANLGYIFHNHLYQGIYLGTELGYDYKFDFGLNLKALLGVGFLQTFSTQDEYRFENGEYVQKTDAGNGRLMPSLSLGAGYRIKRESAESPEIFLLYQSWAEYPYSPGFIPMMTHVSLHLGFKYYFNCPERRNHEK